MGGPAGFAGELGGWDGAFGNVPEGVAGRAVEDEEEAVFGALGDGIDLLAVAGDGEQDGRGGEVFIEEVVVDELAVPETFAGFGVEGD